MKIKKALSVAALTLTVVLTLLTSTSCSLGDIAGALQTATDKLTHEHVFSEWENEIEPTCTSFGMKTRACECGQMEYVTVSALSHNSVTDAAVAATCTTPGRTEGSHCEDCGAIVTAQTETARLAHSFSEWSTVTAPTCTSFGLKKRVCDCGQAEYETLDALSHAVVADEAVAATCTEYGKTAGSHCGTCGVIISVQSDLAPLGHIYDEGIILEQARCNMDGTKRFSCTNLGCSYYYDESYSLSVPDSGEVYAAAVQYTGVIQSFDRFGNFMSEASAFVISADGKIATGNLAIDNAYSLVFVLGDVYYDVTEVLAYNTENNLAVLKIDASDLPYANICSQKPANGEAVYLMGAPSGYISSLLSGVVSNSTVDVEGVEYIQHDIEAKTGCVGAPLINKFGEVVGINVGYVGDDYLGVAVASAVLDEMDYSTPISVYEYGNITYTPAEQLCTWVINNYNGTTDNTIAYVVQGNSFYYSLGYDIVSDYSFAEGYWTKEENYQLYVRVIFDNSEGTYKYYATLTDGVKQNEANGFIDAATYDASTVLTYDTFYGKYWTESDLMALYSTGVYDAIGFFSYCLDTYFDTLTLETFGFTSVSYDRDGEALAKLQSFVMTLGAVETTTGSYVLSGESQMGDDLMEFNITYLPDTGDVVVSVHYYLVSGAKYSAHLTLNATESGNRFDFAYYTFNGEAYVAHNVAWGYLDAASFTSETKLTCYVFSGMDEYEDGLLMDYTSLLNYMMQLLNNSVMPGVSPELSVKDLGFLFYFG